MAINEDHLSAQIRAANAQNRKHPLLINIVDGRLVPNVPRLGGREAVRNADGRVVSPAIPPHPKYRIYHGPRNASREERMRLLSTENSMHAAPVGFDPMAAAKPFDIATATAAELVEFAQQQYGANLSENTPVHLLRGRVKAMAEKAQDLT